MKNLEGILSKVDYDESSPFVIEMVETTTNDKVIKTDLIYELDLCPICGHHSGCNAWRNKRKKSWKRYRKTQWR
jgi:hypothetical protein